MQKLLDLINEEVERNYDDAGRLVSSVDKKYFSYTCHEADANCQLKPVVCRVVDLFHTDEEPNWQSNEPGCKKCFGVNNRALEELYSRMA